ncbi:MAG: hypothetical protein IBJ18_04665 [Phycisphaerales bacterium]|nr:hypothetical protein [Phycisphaerales bacterium]
MAKKSSKTTGKKSDQERLAASSGRGLPMGDLHHPAAKRKNNPQAKIAAEGNGLGYR